MIVGLLCYTSKRWVMRVSANIFRVDCFYNYQTEGGEVEYYTQFNELHFSWEYDNQGTPSRTNEPSIPLWTALLYIQGVLNET